MCVHENTEIKQHHFACCVGTTGQMVYLGLLGFIGDIDMQLYTLEQSACLFSVSISHHQMYALIPNSWFWSFCGTRFQKR